MKELNEREVFLESQFGLISGMMLYGLHEIATAAGSKWDISDNDTIDIPVTKENAYSVYEWCKAIRSGYNVGLIRSAMKKIKEARMSAHKYLFEEANNPNTPIERKIELVKLTSKGN